MLKKIQVPPPTLLMIIHRVTFTIAGKLGSTRVRNFNEQPADVICLFKINALDVPRSLEPA